ncbi:MAG: M48 family metallopeptidase [Caldisericia bacterium]|jgi:STE24 endopeptidase|nr:M48 family metallopeptidase [Caldisericia bacterium]
MINIIFILLFLISNLWELFLNNLNLKHAIHKGKEIPEIFKDTLQEETVEKSLNYLKDKVKLSNIETITKTIFVSFGLIYLFPLFEKISIKIINYLGFKNYTFYQSIIFFVFLGLFIFFIDLPFDIIFTFKIEKKYGFSNITKKLYIVDKIKIIILSLIIGLPLIYGLINFILNYKLFFIPLSLIIIGIIFLINIIYPWLILPLFYKFEKLENDDLKNKIFNILEKVKLKFENIYVMNASSRSTHTNAFFSGIGKTKKIVFYDTLIKNHSQDEILSIFAHELGHYKKGHIFKSFILSSIFIITILFLFNILINTKISEVFYSCKICIDLKIIYTGVFLSSILFPIEFLINSICRKFEFESDEFAAKLTDKDSMILSLKRIFKDNLSNLFPHPLYSKFKYTHPPPIERIEHLMKL